MKHAYHAQRKLTGFLALRDIRLDEILVHSGEKCYTVVLMNNTAFLLTLKSAVISCSVTARMFSSAFSAESNGWNAIIFTIL
jgi:hypothetical protein